MAMREDYVITLGVLIAVQRNISCWQYGEPLKGGRANSKKVLPDQKGDLY